MNDIVGKDMNGTERAALLLMTLGEVEAAEVLKFMGTNEVQKLGTAMASLKSISRNDADRVLDVFIVDVEDESALGLDTENYVRKLLGNAFGANKANAFIERIMSGDEAQGLDALKWMSSYEVANIIQDEHPQIIAIVLAYLEPGQAAEVLDALPEEIRSDIVMRVARLTDIQQSALAEIESLIANKSADAGQNGTRKVGGDRVAAAIVNALKPAASEKMLDEIKEKNEELSTRIQEMMFVFETLLDVDDSGIQTLLREVSNDVLGVALKGCDPEISDKILGNMSKRAATLLREDMDAKGPMKISDVDIAQKEILEAARRLADAGDINLGQSGEEYV